MKNHLYNINLNPATQFFWIAILSGLLLISCDDFLDAKSDQRLAVPTSVEDFQAMIENPTILIAEPRAGEISADDMYLATEDWSSLASNGDRRAYNWQPDYLFEPNSNDWSAMSDAVYACNTVIAGLTEMDNKSHPEYNHVLAQAYYLRGRKLLQASFIWCSVYDVATANQALGMPLRQGNNFNAPSVRTSLAETFEQIINDLKRSIVDLPIDPINVIRPSRPAAYGNLARAYLYMGDYTQAKLYADSCLQLRGELLDFNTLNANATLPIPSRNVEIIYESGMATSQILNLARMRVDSTLYDMYEQDDLRRQIYFSQNSDGSHGFRARMLQAGSGLFSGIAVSEMYLIRMEASARTGDLAQADADLRHLLTHRYRNGAYEHMPLTSAADPLARVLDERRKELAFRGLRWPDLKRLNRDGAGITIQRVLGEQLYTLAPGDPRYALPIPEDVIELSGMQQNPR